MGFPRQEYWSGLPFPSPMQESEKWKMKVKSLSHVGLLVIPWTAAYQAPPSVGFSRQEYWSGVPLPSPEALSVKGLKKILSSFLKVNIRLAPEILYFWNLKSHKPSWYIPFALKGHYFLIAKRQVGLLLMIFEMSKASIFFLFLLLQEGLFPVL